MWAAETELVRRLEAEWQVIAGSRWLRDRLQAWAVEDDRLAFDDGEQLVAAAQRRDVSSWAERDRVLTALLERANGDVLARRVALQVVLPGLKSLIDGVRAWDVEERAAVVVATAVDVLAWCASEPAGTPPSFRVYANTRRRVLRLAVRHRAEPVLELARRSGAIKANPVEGARAPKKPLAQMVFLNADEIMTLADELTDPPIRRGGGEHRRPSYPERGLLVRFASFTGLRSGEIVALRTETIDLLHGRVHVVASATEAYGKLQFGSPKTYQRRTVPLPQALVDELTTSLAGKASSDFVFTSSRGGPLRHSNFYARHYKPAVIRAGLPEATRFHDLRHSYAAMLIAEGAHPRAIMERLGHSTIQVTLGTYGHLFPSLEASLTEALDDVYRTAEPMRPAEVREIEG